MSSKKIAVLFFLLTSFVFADEASHRKVASELLDLAAGPDTFRAGFNLSIEPMLANMRQRGAPEAAIADMKAAITDWLDKEIVWEDLKPGMVDLYVREFSEPELNQILAFYKTTTGRKSLQKLPMLVAEGAKLGQAYAATKQASLMERLQKVATKHNLK